MVPNWVYNRLEINGDPAELADFIAAVQCDPTQHDDEPEALDFARTIPSPPTLEVGAAPPLHPGDVGEHGEMPEWRQWRIEHWGTKWNAMYSSREGAPGDGRVVYRFSTAYSTPDPWLGTISRAHPTLGFVHEYCEEFLHFFGRSRWKAGEVIARDHIEDPLEFAWLEWADDDDADEPQREPEPEPEGDPVDRDAVLVAGQAVLRAVIASRNAQRRRHMYATPADWATAIAEPLGMASRCARLMASAEDAYGTPAERAVGPDREPLLTNWVVELVLAAAEAVKAAAAFHMRAEGGSDYAAQEQLAQAVIDAAVDLDDRAPTGTRPADWHSVLLEALGDAVPVMVADERAGHGWPVADWVSKGYPSFLGGARDRLVEFAAKCVGAIAATARSEAQHLGIEIANFWDEVAANSPHVSGR